MISIPVNINFLEEFGNLVNEKHFACGKLLGRKDVEQGATPFVSSK